MPGSKKLIDIIDEMNGKEYDTRSMVSNKLRSLSNIIYKVVGEIQPYTNPDLEFVNTIIGDLDASPSHRITKLEIEKCNKLYKKYKELN